VSREINRDYAPVGSAAPDATVAATDVPSAPEFGAASYVFPVAEDTAVATQVGTIRATAAGGAAVKHTLTAGNTDGAWKLDAATGELKLAVALDHETTAQYHLIVEARSGPGAGHDRGDASGLRAARVGPAGGESGGGRRNRIRQARGRLSEGLRPGSPRTAAPRQARRTSGRRAGQRRRPYEEGAAVVALGWARRKATPHCVRE